MVIVLAPAAQHRAGVAQGSEQHLVHAFIAQATVKALNLAVLLRLARRHLMPLDRIGIPTLHLIGQRGCHGAEAMSDHLVMGIAHAAQGGVDRVPQHPPISRAKRGEQERAPFGVMPDRSDDGRGLREKGDEVRPAHLGLVRRDGPDRLVKVEVRPPRVAQLASTDNPAMMASTIATNEACPQNYDRFVGIWWYGVEPNTTPIPGKTPKNNYLWYVETPLAMISW